MPDQDPSAIIIPFGKHRGSTVAELLAKDPAYADWLVAQGWLAQRFAELHAAITTRGAGADDSPEHNRIQVRFLDPLFRAALISLTQNVQEARIRDWNDRAYPLKDAVHTSQISVTNAKNGIEYDRKMLTDPFYGKPQYREQRLASIARSEQRLIAAQAALRTAQTELAAFPHLPLLSTVSFEHHGVDARILWAFLDKPLDLERHRYRDHMTIAVEIKPSMGDDYPSVMRQMQRLQCQILLIETYTGAAVPLPLLRTMFEANKCQLLTLQDVEAEMPNAKQLLENPQA